MDTRAVPNGGYTRSGSRPGLNTQRGLEPNRIEQRFGRVHRIGQTEVWHMWGLVAYKTREGQVYRRLLDKLPEMRQPGRWCWRSPLLTFSPSDNVM